MLSIDGCLPALLGMDFSILRLTVATVLVEREARYWRAIPRELSHQRQTEPEVA